ncbi:MAG: hypothetical protein ABIC18_02215 [Candidatus Omnitrophota bacterium]
MASFMIEINLLPEEFKQDKPRQSLLSQVQVFWYILPVVFALLLIIHLSLGGIYISKLLQYKAMEKKWVQLTPEHQKVQEWKKQHKISGQQTAEMNKLLEQRITISDKLQVLSKGLPNGIWLNSLDLKNEKFELKGSVVSLEKDQMRLLNRFISYLKEDARFFKDFSRFELGRVTMRTLGSFAIMDFILEGELNAVD